MKIATSLYPIEWHKDFESYLLKISTWVEAAVETGADLLVFPEYVGVEAALLGTPETQSASRDWIEAASATWSETGQPWSELAETHNVMILAGTGPCRTDEGFVNQARLFAPGFGYGSQNKLTLTPWERDHTILAPGNTRNVFNTRFGRLAVNVCYDAEFPEHARSQETDLLLVPACTDSQAGAERLRIAAKARALEN
ncbi:MAG: nitrilase-related carbon-nitrogen hydrolase [Pseudomonadota bacterium]